MDIYKISKSLEALGLKERDKVLIALSGGVDSLSLAYALKHSKLNLICYAAHMNFSLRGEESNNDQLFVENWCSVNNITLFTKKVDTYKYAKNNSISIEMAARDLRYSWFNELLKEQDIKFLAVGHNADDNAETLFRSEERRVGKEC